MLSVTTEARQMLLNIDQYSVLADTESSCVCIRVGIDKVGMVVLIMLMHCNTMTQFFGPYCTDSGYKLCHQCKTTVSSSLILPWEVLPTSCPFLFYYMSTLKGSSFVHIQSKTWQKKREKRRTLGYVKLTSAKLWLKLLSHYQNTVVDNCFFSWLNINWLIVGNHSRYFLRQIRIIY